MKATVVSVSGDSHTDDVACRKSKEVSDPAVALCPREDAASSLFVFAVYDAFRHVVYGTYTIIIGTNPTRYREIVCYLRYDIKTKQIAVAVSLVREQLVAVAVTRWLLYMYDMYKTKGYRTREAPGPHHNPVYCLLLRVCTEIERVATQGDTAAVIYLYVLPRIFKNRVFCYEVQAHSVKKKAAVRTYCIRTMYQVVVTYISIPGKYQATLPDPTINICTEIGIYFCLRRPLLLQGPRLTYEFGFIY